MFTLCAAVKFSNIPYFWSFNRTYHWEGEGEVKKIFKVFLIILAILVIIPLSLLLFFNLFVDLDLNLCEEDFLEITFAEDGKTIVGARKLVEETRKQKKEAIAIANRLRYGTSKGL